MRMSQRVEFQRGAADGRQTTVQSDLAGTLPDTLAIVEGRIIPGEAYRGEGDLYRLRGTSLTPDGARIYRRV